MLKSQQEAARLRREATEQGFEINVYVPLGLVERKQQQRRQLNEDRDKEDVYKLSEEVIVKTYEHNAFITEVTAQQAQRDKKHVAIIGEPGAGKTTLLSTIASSLEDKTQNLIIYISLANLQGRTIEDYLLKQWLPEAMRLVKSDIVVTPKVECQLIECFSKGRVWLLLDGVDEIGENSPVQALAKINQELTASLRQARVVLTCRLNVWDAKVNNTLSGFDTYKTQEFKPEQTDDFIQQWFEYAKDSQKGEILKSKLKETKHENIRKLVTSPLRLSLLCQTFYQDRQGELPETKAALYQKFTRYFYEWKSELFPGLYQSDDLKDKLHHSLSKLAFAGINSSAKFRLPKSLARQVMDENLFKLACDVGWLNLVERVTETEEEVYAFFHPNFQEYFAALRVSDWHDFLDHVPGNLTRGTYRIFESQWREVILLWLGRREETIIQQQQEFLDALVNFKDRCGKWNRKDVVKGFYEYRAYFLAAAGITEFKGYSKTDKSRAEKLVKQIAKWTINGLSLIEQEARSALQQTDRIKAIVTLVQLLQSTTVDEDTRREAAFSLGKIGTGNEIAIKALVQLLQLTTVDEDTRREAAFSLGRIGTGNEIAITALVQLLQSTTVDDYTRRRAADSLEKIDPSNEIAITALVQLLQSTWITTTVDNYKCLYKYVIRQMAAESLWEIGTGNEIAISALLELLQSTTVDDYTRLLAAHSLGKINSGNEIAISALLELLQSTTVDDYIRQIAAYSLGKIGTGNKIAITALLELLQSTTVDFLIRWSVAKSLGRMDSGDGIVIATLVELLQSTTVDHDTRRNIAEGLGKIDRCNEIAITALVELLQLTAVDFSTHRRVAESLGKIDPGNEFAIAALVQLLQSTTVDDDTRRQAADSLGKIGTANEFAIAALVELLQSTTVDHDTRTQATESLGEIGTGNEFAIAALVELLQSTTVDDDTCRQAADSLGGIIQNNQHRIEVVKALSGYWQLDNNYYHLAWKCAQNMPYPDFYQAWHQHNFATRAMRSLKKILFTRII
ncbi:HEAT repeat domain-containing protein [Nostoc sp. UHCC 0251]|uniref:HEAT repeat domain-containing protein n=1 Tax=Nostoc sp. UHCC 0251 TaxID=3110240 RepID=UPI002B1FC355|nr:HEAT repeat domain-containing protein [Nostoc sp. UHCC 0251]MEA5623647.1 HEAT repeat domain-containing protein [Nostoc sp. UHCC 0251]